MARINKTEWEEKYQVCKKIHELARRLTTAGHGNIRIGCVDKSAEAKFEREKA